VLALVFRDYNLAIIFIFAV